MAFLTYAQCDIDPEQMFQFLKGKFGDQIKIGLIGQEDHKTTEGKHLHCFLEFEKKKDYSDEKKFDIFYNGKIYHPDIKPVKNKIGC